MKIFASKKWFCILVVLVLMPGCILPIPHTRVSRPEWDGLVLDATTGNSISGAMVSIKYEDGINIITESDALGRWRIPSEENWHGAVFIGIPMSYSLFPFFDCPHFPISVSIKANGYDSWEWHSWIDLDGSEDNSKEPTFIDPTRAELKPQTEQPPKEDNK